MTAAAAKLESADLALHADWVIPVEPHAQVLAAHSVVVRDGRILALLPSDQARRDFAVRESVELAGHVLIPGLVNTHTRATVTLRRGLTHTEHPGSSPADKLDEPQVRLSHEDLLRDASELAIACMLRSGTTCCGDAGGFPNILAEALQRNGLRACLGLPVADSASAWARNAGEYLARGTALRDQYRHHPLLSFGFALQAIDRLEEPVLREVRLLADEVDAPVKADLHPEYPEAASNARSQTDPALARLAALGWLTPDFSAVHLTRISAEQASAFAQSGAHLVYCAEFNPGKDRGAARAAERLLGAGTEIALGTDCADSDNAFDMFREMHAAAILAKPFGADARAAAAAGLRMATLNGARALGLAEETGSLVPGKWADLAAVNLDVPECLARHTPLEQLVQAAGRHQVREVWVAGTRLLHQGALTRLDIDELLQRTRRARSCAADPVAENS